LFYKKALSNSRFGSMKLKKVFRNKEITIVMQKVPREILLW